MFVQDQMIFPCSTIKGMKESTERRKKAFEEVLRNEQKYLAVQLIHRLICC